MDIRVEKTRKSIVNAFLALRARKPLEKIRVKELCEQARINKSTFYDHYQDIYDLSDTLETEVVRSVIAGLSVPERLLQEPESFTRELFLGYLSQDSLIRMLFEKFPEYRDDPAVNVCISYSVYGGYHAFFENRRYGDPQVIEIVGRAAAQTVRLSYSR